VLINFADGQLIIATVLHRIVAINYFQIWNCTKRYGVVWLVLAVYIV
jgi:hypothetical protein